MSLNESWDLLKFGDIYELLELNFDATETEIKKAYRQKAILYHPDKTKNDAESTQKFLLISSFLYE